MKLWTAALTALFALMSPAPGISHPAKEDERLSKIGPAPDFALTNQDGRRVALSERRGKNYAAAHGANTAGWAFVTGSLGVRFDPDELLRGIHGLQKEGAAR